MNNFSSAVKQDLSVIRRLVPAVREHSRGFAALLGADKLFAAVQRMLHKRLRRRLDTWTTVARQISQQQQLQLMHKYRALKRMIMKLDVCATRKICGWFNKWLSAVIAERDRLRAIREYDSAVIIQRAARGWLTRLKVCNSIVVCTAAPSPPPRRSCVQLLRARERAGYLELYEATLKLQAFFRGRLARFAYVVAREERRRQRAALAIERVGRGYLGRAKARRLRLHRNQGLAATTIQAWVRGCAGRQVAKRLRWQQAQEIAPLTIQRAARRWLAYQRVKRLRQLKLQAQAAIVIQKYARRWLCRRRLQTTLDERQREYEIRSTAAVKVQAVYRGHRARMRHKAIILQYRAQVRRRMQAALSIQCAVRCRIARKTLLAVKIER